MDITMRVGAAREVLRRAGIDPDRALIRHWWGGILVTLRDDADAGPVAAALRATGWSPVVAGSRSVIAWIDEPD